MATVAAAEIPSHRACAHCRSQKVKCLPDETNPDVCQRCAKTGRPCVFTPMQKRKQRIRTDTRVAELEREMRAMRSMLKNQEDGSSAQQRGEQSGGTRSDHPSFRNRRLEASQQREALPQAISRQETISQVAQAAQMQQGNGPLLWPKRFADPPPEEGGDVIDRGILSMATARQLLETYKKDLFSHYPMVPISASTTADELRTTKPMLFLAIIAAAAGKEYSDLSAVLDKEVLQAYATKSLIRSEKSLEIVQALLISSVWYHPPSKFGQLKYYEYIHMAATMAMDIGIGTRPLQHRSRLGNAQRGREPAKNAMSSPQIHPIEDATNPDLSMTPRSRASSPDTGSTESRRTFLACYAICVGVALSLRRPNMLRVSSYVRECVEHLERAHDALPSDRTVVAWVKLLMIAEEISTAFCFDDPGGIASITELRTQIMLKDFETRLTAWFARTPASDISPSGIIMYYTIRLYLYEVALHIDHSPEDFRAPYQMGTIQPHPQSGEIPTQILAEAISECVHCSHELLTTFLTMSADSCRAMPVFSYVRVSFAAFVLAKLCLSSTHQESRIGKVVDRSALQVDTYLDRAVLHVRDIVGTHRTRVPAIFLALLFKLRQWCLNPAMLETSGEQSLLSSVNDDRPHMTAKVTAPQFEGPRIVEHSDNSTDSSPQGMLDSVGQANRTPYSLESKTLLGLTPADQFSFLDSNNSNNDPSISQTTQMTDGSITIPAQPVESAFDYDQLQQMDMDYSFLDSLSNDFEGGLTGLDDWMPDDSTGIGGQAEGFGMYGGGSLGLGGVYGGQWQPEVMMQASESDKRTEG